jgi:hypothetical protein
VTSQYGDVSVALNDYVALVEIHRPPHNFFDDQLIRDLAEVFDALDNEPGCRAGASFRRKILLRWCGLQPPVGEKRRRILIRRSKPHL